MVAERPSSSSSLEMEEVFLEKVQICLSKDVGELPEWSRAEASMACQTKVTKWAKLERHPTVGTGKKISLVLLDVGRVGMPNNEAGELYKSQVI